MLGGMEKSVGGAGEGSQFALGEERSWDTA